MIFHFSLHQKLLSSSKFLLIKLFEFYFQEMFQGQKKKLININEMKTERRSVYSASWRSPGTENSGLKLEKLAAVAEGAKP